VRAAFRARRAAALAALALAAALVPAAGTRAQGLAFPEVRGRMLDADTITVEHVRAVLYTVRDPRGGERHRYRAQTLHAAYADTAWGRRLARALLAAGPSDSLRRCVPRPPAGDSADALVAGVTFRGRRGVLGVLLFFGSRCAQVFADGAPAGSIDLGTSAGALLDQVQRALPADTALGAIALTEPLPADTGSRFFPLAIPSPVDSLPRSLVRTRPAWPRGAAGPGPVEVRVLALVDENGSVAEARAREPRPPFDDAAVQAVRSWRFVAARRAGRPVRAWVEIPVRFEVR
jgi:TonB family protein